jgi:hypothetical protein
VDQNQSTTVWTLGSATLCRARARAAATRTTAGLSEYAVPLKTATNRARNPAVASTEPKVGDQTATVASTTRLDWVAWDRRQARGTVSRTTSTTDAVAGPGQAGRPW